ASDITGDAEDCFTPSFGSDGPQSGGLNVVNVGNVNINVTFAATKNGSQSSGATTFWGVPGGKYLYKCVGNGTIDASGYANIQNISGQLCVSNVTASAGFDAFTLHVNITIPEAAYGYKNDTLTFFASQT
ncbi:MAG TPA: hypothetical protein VKE88_00750, partial [Candidatus Nanoarchaeia archaeon]|nr:hypothetical protein [Candidatus Nanoarchaeia archaeon]